MTTPPKPTLDEALDALPEGTGTVSIDRDGNDAEVDVVEADRLGVRVPRGAHSTRPPRRRGT